jgi:hypothetical protein
MKLPAAGQRHGLRAVAKAGFKQVGKRMCRIAGNQQHPALLVLPGDQQSVGRGQGSFPHTSLADEEAKLGHVGILAMDADFGRFAQWA